MSQPCPNGHLVVLLDYRNTNRHFQNRTHSRGFYLESHTYSSLLPLHGRNWKNRKLLSFILNFLCVRRGCLFPVHCFRYICFLDKYCRIKSVVGESNPRLLLGKQQCYRNTYDAHTHFSRKKELLFTD